MKYLNVNEIAKIWNVSERSVRNYCQQGRVIGAYQKGKSWYIPENSIKPVRKKRIAKKEYHLLEVLKLEKEASVKGGIYHKIQVDLTYNSNHIEGSCLTHDQTRYIYETNTIGINNVIINVDDIIETTNHFRCIDLIIDQAHYKLSETFVKQLHFILKNGTLDSKKVWFEVGNYKKLPNEVGGLPTTSPEDVGKEMKKLIKEYNKISKKTLEEIIEFHYRFEKIHPFQDGNGRVGRLIMFKECLKNGITPFIINDDLKLFYYRGLKEWKNEKGYLMDICLTAQDQFKLILDYFKIRYED